MEHRIETGLYGRPLDRTNSTDASVNYRGLSYPLYNDIVAFPLAPLCFHTVQIFFHRAARHGCARRAVLLRGTWYEPLAACPGQPFSIDPFQPSGARGDLCASGQP